MALSDFQDILDKPDWRIIAPQLNASVAWGSIAWDEQNNDERYLGAFQLVSNTVVNMYNTVNDGPSFIWSPGLAGTFGAGANTVFMPSAGTRGTIAAGATLSTIVPSATLGATIPRNRLASRGIKGTWFRIRIIDNGAGGTGKTEEKIIIGNTEWTTPTIKLDSDLSFTPVAGSSFEIFSGRVFFLWAGTLAAWSFKYFDLALGIFSGNLSIANLPATIGTDSQMIVLDELYNPKNKTGYEGYVWRLGVSAVNATTLTCATAAFPNVNSAGGVGTNQFRNFQIRIAEDTVNPTAAGQRQIISSHTSGTTPVFTIYAAWTVTPSTSAKFVIENPNEIIFRTAGTATYSYAPFQVRNNATLTTAGAQADTWSAVRYAASSTAAAAGVMMFQWFGFPIGDTSVDPLLLHRHSEIFQFRWGSTALDVLDIAGGATGAWTNTRAYMSIGTTFGAWSTIAYDSIWENGKFAYVNLNGTQFFYRFNIFTMDIWEWVYLRQAQGTAVAGGRMWTWHALDRSGAKVSTLNHLQSSGVLQHECFITT